MSEESGGRTEHQRQLWSALDLTAHALAFHVVTGRADGSDVPGPAVLYLETARAIAIEGLGFEEARKAATERAGTSDEQVVRWAEEFLRAWEDRVSRDYFEQSDADDLAELWGQHKGRPPRGLVDIENLIRELWGIIERSPNDPKRQELLSFVPGGSAREVREVLSRRRGR